MRRSNFFREKRILDIIDEVEEREKLQAAFEEKEAKRDMTYEEFLLRYGEMIDQKAGSFHSGGNVERAISQHSRPVTGHHVGDI